MSIKVITLDLDDTLWDCESVISKAERTFYDWLARNYPLIAERYSPPALVAHRRETFATEPHMQHDLSYLRKRWLRILGEQSGHGDALVEAGFAVFWHARNDVTLYPGVTETLAELSKTYRLATITNGNADVEHIGIGHWFEATVTAAEAGAAKPGPEIFAYTLDKLGVGPEEAVHVGDDPLNDILGAAQHGMRTVWINPAGRQWEHDIQPDADLQHIGQLSTVLAAWR